MNNQNTEAAWRSAQYPFQLYGQLPSPDTAPSIGQSGQQQQQQLDDETRPGMHKNRNPRITLEISKLATKRKLETESVPVLVHPTETRSEIQALQKEGQEIPAAPESLDYGSRLKRARLAVSKGRHWNGGRLTTGALVHLEAVEVRLKAAQKGRNLRGKRIKASDMMELEEEIDELMKWNRQNSGKRPTR